MSVNKYCIKCGAAIKLGANYCLKCGTEQPQFIDRNAKISEIEYPAITNNVGAIKKTSIFDTIINGIKKIYRAIPKFIKIVILIVSIFLVFGISIIASRSNDLIINGKELFRLELGGFDTKGKVIGGLAVEYEHIEKENISDVDGAKTKRSYRSKSKNSKYLSLDEKELKKAFETSSTKEAVKLKELLVDEIEFEYSKKDNLKNGDKITVKVKYNKLKLSNKDIRLKNTEFDIKISGLVEVVDINITDCFEVIYYGYDGVGTGDISYLDNELFIKSYFNCSNSDTQLKNGDLITTRASIKDKSHYDNENGGILTDNAFYRFEYEEYFFKYQTVSGLKPTTKIDPFKYVEIAYLGFGDSKYIVAQFVEDTPQLLLLNVNFRFKEDYNYKYEDGEEIIVFASDTYDELANQGYALSSTTKKFYYDSSKHFDYIDNIDEFTYETCKSEMETYLKDKLESMEKNPDKIEESLWPYDLPIPTELKIKGDIIELSAEACVIKDYESYAQSGYDIVNMLERVYYFECESISGNFKYIGPIYFKVYTYDIESDGSFSDSYIKFETDLKHFPYSEPYSNTSPLYNVKKLK